MALRSDELRGPPGWELAAPCPMKLSSNNQDIKLSAATRQSQTCVTGRPARWQWGLRPTVRGDPSPGKGAVLAMKPAPSLPWLPTAHTISPDCSGWQPQRP